MIALIECIEFLWWAIQRKNRMSGASRKNRRGRSGGRIMRVGAGGKGRGV